MKTLVVSFLFCGISSLLFAAPDPQASQAGQPKPSPTPVALKTIKLDSYLKNLGPDDILEKMDSAGKMDHDIFVVFKKNADGTRQLSMQFFDLNRDKKIDLAKFFEKGKLARTETDLDYDGVVDVISLYDSMTGELKKKIQADGDTTITKYYFKNEMRRKELDRNADGKPDMWIYYRGGKISRTEIDKNFDGKAIRIEGPLNPSMGKKTSSNKETPNP